MRSKTTIDNRGSAHCGSVLRTLSMGLFMVLGFQHPAMALESISDGDIEAIEVEPNFFMIAGAGGNIAVSIGVDGVVLVDTGSADRADRVLALIKRLTKQPIRYIINTSGDSDHVGGNDRLSLAGVPILPAGYQRAALTDRDFAPILAEQHVQDRMASLQGKLAPPSAAWPSLTYSIESGETQRKMFLNGQGVQVTYQPNAHSDGDSVVHFRRSDVVVTGDIMDVTRFPLIDPSKGGSIRGVIDSLNRIVEMAISSTPFPYQEGGTLIIPGHGRLCTTTELTEYRDMVTVVRDRVQDAVGKGMALAQVLQTNPTQGYRRRYGSDRGPWTTDMFVTAVYQDLTSKRETRP
jgi:glyoxylase-like metal-dependent hydrolase (beta-lactamase superfamily II)